MNLQLLLASVDDPCMLEIAGLWMRGRAHFNHLLHVTIVVANERSSKLQIFYRYGN